jgi:3-oxoadipate enol-lactonase
VPDVDADGCRIHFEIEGPQDAPVLMLSNSLGTTLHMWDAQVAPFTQHFRLLRYDRRGHGLSGVTKGPYSMERLAQDALAILDALDIKKANWCGLSMGGMVGQWLGAHAASRIEKLVLSNTACYFPDKGVWNDRIKRVRDSGLAAIVDATLERWFTKPFRESAPEAIQRMREMFLTTYADGYVGCSEAIRDMDHRPLLAGIAVPTLVIAGRHDPATTVEAAEFMRRHIRGAELKVLEAAHIANIEQPQDYADAVLAFLLNA